MSDPRSSWLRYLSNRRELLFKAVPAGMAANANFTGDWGGDETDVGLFIEMSTRKIPPTSSVVSTSGWRTVGLGRAKYVRIGTAPAAWGEGQWWFRDATGAYFELNELEPDAYMFGAYADGVKAAGTNAISGHDDSGAINALIYYCQIKGVRNARLRSGKYRVSDTIHLGYGGGSIGRFSNINLIGDGPVYRSHELQIGFPGTAIIADFSDRMIINVQGQRNSTIKGILIVGMFSKYCLDKSLTVALPNMAPSVDDRDVSLWWDPALSPTQDGRYTPYAAICIDGYLSERPTPTKWMSSKAMTVGDVIIAGGNLYVARSSGTTAASGSGPIGTSSTVENGTVKWAYIAPYDAANPSKHASYPDANYPAYAAVSGQFNKASSSGITIEDCIYEGVIVGCAVQPGSPKADSNGDFLRHIRVGAVNVKYYCSIGATQSRNVGFYDVSGVNCVFSFIEGLTHGKRSGRFQGPLVNVSTNGVMNLFNIAGVYGAPITCIDNYHETLDRIGNVVGSKCGGIVFIGGDLNMTGMSLGNTRGLPDTRFSGSKNRHIGCTISNAPLRFINTSINYDGVCVLMSSDVTIDDGFCDNTTLTNYDGVPPLYLCAANTALAGGIVTPSLGSNPAINATYFRGRYNARNLSTGEGLGQVSCTGGVARQCNRAFGTSFYTRHAKQGSDASAVSIERRVVSLSKSSHFLGLSLVGRILTGSWVLSYAAAEEAFVLPGDVLLDDSTGKVFFVYALDKSTREFRAVLMNGYAGLPSRETVIGTQFSVSVGTFSAGTGRQFIPSHSVYVSTEASKAYIGDIGDVSSPIITNCLQATLALVGKKLIGAGIAPNTVAIGVDGANVYLSQKPTAIGTGISFTFGTASTVLRDVNDGTGTATGSAEFVVGDFIPSHVSGSEAIVSSGGATVVSIDDINRTVTLSSVPSWPSRTNVRLRNWRRAPPIDAPNP